MNHTPLPLSLRLFICLWHWKTKDIHTQGKTGIISQLGDPYKQNVDEKIVCYELFGNDLFKKETNIAQFVGMMVRGVIHIKCFVLLRLLSKLYTVCVWCGNIYKEAFLNLLLMMKHFLKDTHTSAGAIFNLVTLFDAPHLPSNDNA